MKLTITVDVPMPTYVAEGRVGLSDAHLYNVKRNAETRAMIDKAIRATLVKRGAWEPRMKISVQDVEE